MRKRDLLRGDKEKIEDFIFLCTMAAIVAMAMWLASCGSVKTTVKSQTDVHKETTLNADSIADKTTETKVYGDTVKATNLIPLSFWAGLDSAKKNNDTVFTISTESAGIKQTQRFVPHYDAGRFDGLTESNLTIAKPTAINDTREVSHSDVSQTTVKDSTARVHSTTTKTIGWGLPSWVWWVLGVVILVTVISIALKFFRV